MVSCAGLNGEKKDKSILDKKFDLYYSQGTANLVKKDYTSALSYFIKAYDLKQNDSKLLNNMGMTYYFKNRVKKAHQYLVKSLKIDPKNSDARNNLASLYFIQGKYKAAKQQYKLVIADLIYQDQHRAHYNLGLIYIREKNYDAAIKEIQVAAKLRQDYCAANYQLGKVFYIKRNYIEAIKSFREAQKGTCVKEPLPHWNQALTYIKMNDFHLARRKLKEIIERFGATKFSALANNKLRKISSLEMIKEKDDLKLKEKYFGKR